MTAMDPNLCPYCRTPLDSWPDDIETYRCMECGPISQLEVDRYNHGQCPQCGQDRKP